MNRTIISLAVMGVLLVWGGYSIKHNTAARGQRPATQTRKPRAMHHVFHVWGREGWTEHRENYAGHGYVFYEWTAQGTEGHAVLESGYGMMIFCEGWKPDAVPRFELYAHDRGVVVRTTDLAAFKRELSHIPTGETLRCFNTCAGGTHSGLDRALIEEIVTFCRQRGIVFVEGNEEVICVCA
ncbi:MAG: hypothetical protein JW741_29640 [Sedimentisphaerales bacterium]|nr:hypothetical protein [Sedimentisphaerales bacterium]